MNELDKQYWSNRYKTNETGWDVGGVSTPLKEYFDQIGNKEIRILIPGAGNAYEAEYLYQQGFKNVFLLDISPEPIYAFQNRVPGFPEANCICEDFFLHHGKYDLIVEQTFFCALHPSLRERYVLKMQDLLAPEGKLMGLLFKIPLNTPALLNSRSGGDGPPFGGNETEYRNLFECKLVLQKMETAHNSIKPREGNELFFVAKKSK